VFGGLKDAVYIWPLERPGSPLDRRKTKLSNGQGATGIASCFAFDQDSQIETQYTVGFYSGRVVKYSNDHRVIFQTKVPGGGVTQVKYSPCGRYLWVGGRRSSHLYCWDMRMASRECLTSIPRSCKTNQHLEFDLQTSTNLGSIIASGNSDHSHVDFWSIDGGNCKALKGGLQVLEEQNKTQTIVNSVSFHPQDCKLALASGQRRIPAFPNWSSDDDEEVQKDEEAFSKAGLSIWKLK